MFYKRTHINFCQLSEFLTRIKTRFKNHVVNTVCITSIAFSESDRCAACVVIILDYNRRTLGLLFTLHIVRFALIIDLTRVASIINTMTMTCYKCFAYRSCCTYDVTRWSISTYTQYYRINRVYFSRINVHRHTSLWQISARTRRNLYLVVKTSRIQRNTHFLLANR